MKKTWIVATTIAVTAVFATIAVAQPGPPDDKGKKRKHERWNRAETQERVELMKMWKLTDALDLDQETAAKLFPLMNEYDAKIREIRKQRHEISKQMREELDKSETDSAALRRMIDDFKKNELNMAEMKVKKFEAMSKVLTDEQAAKALLLIPQFERDMKKMFGEVREWRQHRRQMREGDEDFPKKPRRRMSDDDDFSPGPPRRFSD